jgi:hypothetical protein
MVEAWTTIALAEAGFQEKMLNVSAAHVVLDLQTLLHVRPDSVNAPYGA